ncbi:DUF3748 domain-containing protein [Planctomycetales bacterium ZRK34]|nr:DUF3748 domain-containing protein [Planctomycetales bacterium ZRK34]
MANVGCSGTARLNERQITHAPHGHILTNTGVWSHDGQWIIYDIRHPSGSVFNGNRIERINVDTGAVEVLYKSSNGAYCGVVTASPVDDRVVFIHGPEQPTDDWQYAAYHRRGVIVDADAPGKAINLDARDLTEPFTPGALRGGTHVHVFSPDGQWVSFTYEDHVLAALGDEPDPDAHEHNHRNVGVSVPDHPVRVTHDHPRNHDGEYFTVLVTRTTDAPAPGSDQISKAYSDAWVGIDGYLRPDGSRQHRAIAFQGNVVAASGDTISEAYIVDLPDDLTRLGDGPLAGTATTRPRPPAGVVQRRLTFTADRKYPGLQGPRHWLRSSPDGSHIAMLMRDDAGVVQLWTASPNSGESAQLTHNAHDIASAFSWSPDGRWIAHMMDRSVCITDAQSGQTTRLSPRVDESMQAPWEGACVFSPDGRRIAYIRNMPHESGGRFNQVFITELGSH